MVHAEEPPVLCTSSGSYIFPSFLLLELQVREPSNSGSPLHEAQVKALVVVVIRSFLSSPSHKNDEKSNKHQDTPFPQIHLKVVKERGPRITQWST